MRIRDENNIQFNLIQKLYVVVMREWWDKECWLPLNKYGGLDRIEKLTNLLYQLRYLERDVKRVENLTLYKQVTNYGGARLGFISLQSPSREHHLCDTLDPLDSSVRWDMGTVINPQYT